ncbi:MAG: DUF2723 domain-containing protein [Flavobacteriaceae bacterium]|nr:DUF2723 domain-containing protein [Flavobacteriaceae bacterium]
MNKSNYYLLNTWLGWIHFLIALIIFSLTVEPTASFWDAGEYIATSAKLQIGHPPGAPFYQMMGAFFAMFAPSAENIALFVNLMSVFSSSFTILFMFWTLTLLLRKLPSYNNLKTTSDYIGFFGSASIGSLAFCFSDSFWFNAVEAEVYAMTTLILAVLFWLGLKWENEMNTPYGDRWLLLISFVIGLSFGVHFMGLLTIPAIGMLYYFKNYKSKITVKNFLIANIISVAILLFIFKLLLPLTLAFFGKTEVYFVNTLGLPFNSGTIFSAASIVLFFIYSLRLTIKKNWVNINTGILCILFVLLGFSSWIMLPIRANANTVINENSPSDARQLLAYYNLEQYPDTYLFYGPMFSDMYAGQDIDEPYIDDKPKYERDTLINKYVIVNNWEKSRINSNKKHRGFLPRLWSSEHAANYINFTGPLSFSINPSYKGSTALKERVDDFKYKIAQEEVNGEDYHNFFREFGPYLEIEMPSFLSNLSFLFNYQIGYMYWRYFMWNFTGRQNDNQGRYDILDGNWISGIPFFDELRLGNQNKLTKDALSNKARNTYFFLPFILGIIGLFFLYNEDKMKFWVLLLFFLFTGLALKIYLNERPFEPRERDYALVGSFYVFAIWIGIGAYSLVQKIKEFSISKYVHAGLIIILISLVPFLMAYQNWDDHDRSNRYTAQSMAKSYLASIQKNSGAIIFTIGDNDTFALWYAQEIEGFRTDVKTINTSLLATDWYIDQLKRKTYESDPIPSQLTHKLYAYGIRDYIKHESLIDSIRWDIKNFMDWVSSDHPRTKYKNLILQSGGDPDEFPVNTQEMIYYPTNKIRLNVNIDNVISSGVVKEKDIEQIVPYIDINLPKSGITKNQLMMLDIIANNDWKRPIYFTGGSNSASEYIWMKDYLQLEGLVYKLVPIKTEKNKNNPYLMGRLDTNIMYEIIKNWEWGNSESKSIYHDPETRKNSISYRSNMARLAEKLIDEGKLEKAKEIIDLAIKKMPIEFFGFYSLIPPFIEGYYRLGETESSRQLFLKIREKYEDKLRYFKSLELELQYNLAEEILTEIERYRALIEVVQDNQDNDFLGDCILNFQNSSQNFIFLYGDYEYYTIMDEFIEGLYLSNNNIEARKLLLKIAKQYDERFKIISELSEENQTYLEDRIKEEMDGYRRLILYSTIYDKKDFSDSIEKRVFKSISNLKNLESLLN